MGSSGLSQGGWERFSQLWPSLETRLAISVFLCLCLFVVTGLETLSHRAHEARAHSSFPSSYVHRHVPPTILSLLSKCKYTSGYIGLCMYTYVYTCIRPQKHVYMYACMYACMHVGMNACLHICMFACLHACMYACMPMYIYIYTYVCT